MRHRLAILASIVSLIEISSPLGRLRIFGHPPCLASFESAPQTPSVSARGTHEAPQSPLHVAWEHETGPPAVLEPGIGLNGQRLLDREAKLTSRRSCSAVIWTAAAALFLTRGAPSFMRPLMVLGVLGQSKPKSERRSAVGESTTGPNKRSITVHRILHIPYSIFHVSYPVYFPPYNLALIYASYTLGLGWYRSSIDLISCGVSSKFTPAVSR